MRWSSVLVPFSLLFAGVLGDDASERFTQFHTKALASSPIKLNDASYKEVTALPRDYSFAVLLTATDPRFGCQMCREFGPEWDLLSSSWTKGDKAGKSKLIFGVLDFNEGRETFMALGLQTAPVLLLFQPTTGDFAVSKSEPLRFDFTSGSPSAESVRDWIVRHTPDRYHPDFKRPTDYVSALLYTIGFAGFGTAAVQTWQYFGWVVRHPKLWMGGSLVFILMHTSGHMFNSIRNTPYVGGDGRGHISYIAGGFQSQFGMESQIIATLYGALAVMAIMLADRVPRFSNSKVQQVAVIGYAGAMLLLYSFLLSIFRVKNGGYPFALPPFL